ncbi:MAG: F0F1 ATP synthase subunit epsilon [Planctomycetota bacterium]|jgi:F-type H+-transporting ATPase subunit epsilon
MKLKVLLPTKVLVDEEVSKVVAEGIDGSFCLLPRHADFVSMLVPGVLTCEKRDGGECHIAVDGGVLVKSADEVLVSTRRAVEGAELGKLTESIRASFREIDEKEQGANRALAKLEAGIIRRFVETGLAR